MAPKWDILHRLQQNRKDILNEKEIEDIIIRDLLSNSGSKIDLECEDVIEIDSNTFEFLTAKDLVKREREREIQMDFITYPKINSLWKRHGLDCKDPAKKKQFIEGNYSCPEFGIISEWHVEEKIDGTNIRIFFDKENKKVRFGGRTGNAQIPTFLLQYLQDHFTFDRFGKTFSSDAVLFGEGFGPRIQKSGEFYSDDPGFVLFDINCGQWWLERETVYVIASELEVDSPPIIHTKMSEEEIVSYVKSNPTSVFAKREMRMEGVVCRPSYQMLFRGHTPVVFKLKCKDFQ